MEPVHEEEYKGKVIRIYQDEDPMSPRDWDGLAPIVTWHDHWRTDGKDDEHINRRDGEAITERLKELKRQKAIVLPVFMYEHSGMSVWAGDGAKPYPFSDPWDAGQVGFTYATRAMIREWRNVKRVTKKMLDDEKKAMQQEVSTLNDYLSGNVYGYEVVEPETDAAPEEVLDSCWGFYGDYDDKDYSALKEAKEAVDAMEAH